jgi:hypothetical protein
MKPVDEIDNRNPEDPLSFWRLAQEARTFLASQQWCKSIRRGFLDIGWEGILAVFYFELEPASEEVDDSVWVVVGDLPPAYISNTNTDGATALDGYVYEMQRWVDAVKNGRPADDLVPVDVPATLEHAEMLEKRLDFIRQRLLSD